jgi:hypothetical protein
VDPAAIVDTVVRGPGREPLKGPLGNRVRCDLGSAYCGRAPWIKPVLGRRRQVWCEMNVDKAQIVAILRSRGLNTRADWADRTLPDIVDTVANAGLLRTLAIAPESLQLPADAAAPRPGPGSVAD